MTGQAAKYQHKTVPKANMSVVPNILQLSKEVTQTGVFT